MYCIFPNNRHNNNNDFEYLSGGDSTELKKQLTTNEELIGNDQQDPDENEVTHESASFTINRFDDKGPIEYFNETKKTLRHVIQLNHDSPSTLPNVFGNEGRENMEKDETYVKVPVQQLINTFEKQMRSIIKQKINENIKLSLTKNSNNNKNFITDANVMKSGSVSNDMQMASLEINMISDNTCEINNSNETMVLSSMGEGSTVESSDIQSKDFVDNTEKNYIDRIQGNSQKIPYVNVDDIHELNGEPELNGGKAFI